MRIAGEGDLEAIAATLAGAFERDPLWAWAFESEDGEGRLAALRVVFGFYLAAAIDLGWVRVTDRAEAAALWIPPGSPEMSPADEARFPDVVAGACSADSARRVLELAAAFGRNHPHEPPHFYLSVLGTHPDHRGQGHGAGLLAACLAEIDAADPPAAAFLESSDAGNLPLYEGLGFRATREVELIAGLRATQMWRAPAGID